MSSQSPAFALEFPAEPIVIGVARSLASLIGNDEAITTALLRQMLTEHFGGTDAAGRWSVRDAHAALELAQVMHLNCCGALRLDMTSASADVTFSRLDRLVPTQTVRSDEQIELQQFATPPRLAWLAARACALAAGELVLEPSAGTGMLSVWASKAAGRLALNEISPLRRGCLEVLFPAAAVTGFDGELIDELLDPAVIPSVVLMNPPYSHSVERGHDGRTGDRHLRSAWSRLARGGRLVAIMPEWFDVCRFTASLTGPVSLRLNAAIERGFTKQGTSITTRLLVLDKSAQSSDPVFARGAGFGDLASMIDALPLREVVDGSLSRSNLPRRTPFQLVPASRSMW